MEYDASQIVTVGARPTPYVSGTRDTPGRMSHGSFSVDGELRLAELPPRVSRSPAG